MNEEDSEQMSLFMEAHGYLQVTDAAEADVVLLNTCSVRRKPEEKVYSKLGELREMKLERPGMVIAVCGCMAQAEHAELRRRAPYVDLLIGTGKAASIPAMVDGVRAERAAGRRGRLQDLVLPERKGKVVADVPLRTLTQPPSLRAFVPIMYGCDKFCTFCIVPLTRGRERSRPSAEVVDEVRRLAARGTREVTLLGQTVNSYGKNLPEGRVPFAELLRQIDAIPGIKRIRFTSPYPRDFTDELVNTIASLETVCEQVHLPIQVADDDLLGRMHRGYTVAEYQLVVEKLRSRVPGIAISTDVMLGFPGETHEQFLNTMRFVEETRFDSAFMFAYSPRPGTKAADMPDQVPQDVKVARLSALIDLQSRISLEVNQDQLGAHMEVLVDGPSPRDPSRFQGLTRTFKTVNILPGVDGSAADLTGRFVQVELVEAQMTGFTGRLVD